MSQLCNMPTRRWSLPVAHCVIACALLVVGSVACQKQPPASAPRKAQVAVRVPNTVPATPPPNAAPALPPTNRGDHLLAFVHLSFQEYLAAWSYHATGAPAIADACKLRRAASDHFAGVVQVPAIAILAACDAPL